jgi:hypothetical protein
MPCRMLVAYLSACPRPAEAVLLECWLGCIRWLRMTTPYCCAPMVWCMQSSVRGGLGRRATEESDEAKEGPCANNTPVVEIFAYRRKPGPRTNTNIAHRYDLVFEDLPGEMGMHSSSIEQLSDVTR